MKICQLNAKEMVKGLRGALELGWVCWEGVTGRVSLSGTGRTAALIHPLL